MNAREKLNAATFLGAVILGGAAGLLTHSWAVFILVVIVILFAAFQDRTIRLTPDNGPHSHRSHRRR